MRKTAVIIATLLPLTMVACSEELSETDANRLLTEHLGGSAVATLCVWEEQCAQVAGVRGRWVRTSVEDTDQRAQDEERCLQSLVEGQVITRMGDDLFELTEVARFVESGRVEIECGHGSISEVQHLTSRGATATGTITIAEEDTTDAGRAWDSHPDACRGTRITELSCEVVYALENSTWELAAINGEHCPLGP